MTDDRESILSRVRGALTPLHERTPLPDIDAELTIMRRVLGRRDLLAVFSERLTLANGRVVTDGSVLAETLRAGGWMHGYCDPVLWPRIAPFLEGFQVEQNFDRTRVDDFAFGITRAAGAIAETGTIILNEATTSNRLAALAPWVHIAVVNRAEIYPDVGIAVGALGQDPNIIWVTGPSKTADVEGILIEGVHGPGIQIAFVV